MRDRWGNKRGMFYLAKILVYPDNSYLLFIRPDYQQVPGGGGVGGVSHRKFFSLLFIAFSLFVFLWYSLNTNFVPSFASLAETPKVKSTPTGCLTRTPRFPPLASFLTFTAHYISVFCQVWSSTGGAWMCWRRRWDFGASN